LAGRRNTFQQGRGRTAACRDDHGGQRNGGGAKGSDGLREPGIDGPPGCRWVSCVRSDQVGQQSLCRLDDDHRRAHRCRREVDRRRASGDAGRGGGRSLGLLAMGSTASSYLNFDGAFIPAEQVLSTDFKGFLQAVRPTMLLLQSAMCLGLTRTTVDQSRLGLSGVNEVFTVDADRIAAELADAEAKLVALASAVGSGQPPTKKELLSLRLVAAE